MASVALVRLQPVCDCRWSRPGRRLTGVADALQPESAWVCVREGGRRNISETECLTCPHSELDAAVSGTWGRSATLPRAAFSGEQLLWSMTRVLLVLTAALFAAIGVVTLTGPVAVPVTVTLWLCAAAFAGLAVFWHPNG
jgi:hypothetical protein